jgi:signal peptidase II
VNEAPAKSLKERLAASRQALLWGPASVMLISIGLDQASKFWTVAASGDRNGFRILEVIPGWFNLRDVRNPGAAWGLGGEYTPVLALISLACALYVIYDFAELTAGSRIRRYLGGLFLGGVIGNFFDRAFREGGVVDMFEVYLPWPWCEGGKYHYPVFNIADACICVAVISVIALEIFSRKKKPEEAPPADGNAS